MPDENYVDSDVGTCLCEMRAEVKLLQKKSTLAIRCVERYLENPTSLKESLSLVLNDRLTVSLDTQEFSAMFFQLYIEAPELLCHALQDLQITVDRDPATHAGFMPFLFHKGFHALQIFRASSWYWRQGDHLSAMILSSACAARLSVDIHPAAHIEPGIFVDHGDGIVIGETATVGTGCTILHGVTLGGNGKERGDRHPKIGSNVLIGANAMVLGNIRVGDSAHIGAGAVVLRSVPPRNLAIGVPATCRPISALNDPPAVTLDHQVSVYSRTYDEI